MPNDYNDYQSLSRKPGGNLINRTKAVLEKKRKAVGQTGINEATRAPSEIDTDPTAVTRNKPSFDNQPFPVEPELTQPNVDIAARGRRVSGYPEQPDVTNPGRTGDQMWANAIGRRAGIAPGNPMKSADDLTPRLDNEPDKEDVNETRPTNVEAPVTRDPDLDAADRYEEEAAKPQGPQNKKETLIKAVRDALEGLGGHYYQAEQQRVQNEQFRQESLYKRAREAKDRAQARANEVRLEREHKETIGVATKRNELEERDLNFREGQANKPKLLQQSPGEQDILYDPNSGEQKAAFQGPPVKPPAAIHDTTETGNGVYQFNPESGKFDIYVGPPKPRGGQNQDNLDTKRRDHSYDVETRRIDAIAKPNDDRITRLQTIKDSLDQRSPQADSLIAPELLTAMAGGQGSGLRMNEAEIQRIVGGRNAWENLRSAVARYQADPSKPFLITDVQRAQIQKLVDKAYSRASRKSDAVMEARRRLADAQSPEEHRRITIDLQNALNKPDNEGEVETKVINGVTYEKVNGGWQARKQ